MEIKQSEINTFNRVGIPYEELLKDTLPRTVSNRFSGETCETSALVAYLVDWVYQTSNAYEMGSNKVRLDDFDRVRYFILHVDQNVYSTCID
jgi:hypothetical protein